MKRCADEEVCDSGEKVAKHATSPSSKQAAKADGSKDPDADLPTLLDVAVRAVAHAAAIAQTVQAKGSGFGGTMSIEKTDTSPVTVADFAVQCLVTKYIGEATGVKDALRLVAEEETSLLEEGARSAELSEVAELLTAHFPFDELKYPADSRKVTSQEALDLLRRGNDAGGKLGRFWVLDPIDGTKGFIRGAQYAVGLGLVQDGKPVLSAMACPNLPSPGGDVETRAEGNGFLFCALHDWAGCVSLAACRKVIASSVKPLSWSEHAEKLSAGGTACQLEAATMCESYEHRAEGSNSVMSHSETLQQLPGKRLDSMAKYALVARGDAHIYLRGGLTQRTECIWDHCAGVPIAEAAGGKVTDFNGNPLDFSCGRKLTANHGILAANASVHSAVLAEIARIRSKI